ncbi:MAG: NADH:flavin oxidoreductase/NADH oxidase [Acetobacteraceae bacterium]|nr:NADH:flavin oxidoreductase/NADH oxidase [Acetobacteraceae bacterium]
MSTPQLFEPVSFRSVTARNRITVAPMCQYSADNGLGSDFHVQHLGARSFGGAGIVMTEATAVDDIGRITPQCLGLWKDEHTALLKRLADVITLGGAVPAIQLAHAGRKASCVPPWEGGMPILRENGGWRPVAPSPIAFNPDGIEPMALSTGQIAGIAQQFATTAKRALEAGFKIAEIHSAHGYLSHSFLSPISNQRNDAYGGDLSGRSRFLMETLDAVRAVWPAELPLFVRLSCSDYKAGGLTIEDIVTLCRKLKARGDVDLIDCSSGGITPDVRPPSLHPGYQVPFADAIKHNADIATGAVGLIQDPQHAAEIISNRRADLVFVARVMLADPAWPLRAAKALGVKVEFPQAYGRALIH